jgi:hypothetical protein
LRALAGPPAFPVAADVAHRKARWQAALAHVLLLAHDFHSTCSVDHVTAKRQGGSEDISEGVFDSATLISDYFAGDEYKVEYLVDSNMNVYDLGLLIA